MSGRALLIAVAMTVAPAAQALMVAGVDVTTNTLPPGNGAPWDHVGSIGGTTGVYLGAFGGGYWVITAAHVGIGALTLNNVTYTAVAGSGVQIGGADVFVYRIDSNPGLTNLALSAVAPGVNAAVTMIGAGVKGDATLLNWSVNQNGNTSGASGGAAWTWTAQPDASGANLSGYGWGSGKVLRWGTNAITGTTSYNIGTGTTSALYTTFNPITGEAQGAAGDSGGAMFYLNGSTWELAGILGAIGTFNNQPGATAVFGNITYAADISVYRSAITSAIPEPAGVVAWSGVLVAGVALWRRRRRA